MLQSILTLSLLIISLSVYSSPADVKIIEEINNNVSHEYVSCASYFNIVAGAMKKSGDEATANQYSNMSNYAIEHALLVAKQDRTQEMAEKVTLARLKVESEAMLKSIDKSYSNISILSSQYANNCKEAMENPERVFEKWQVKIYSKHSKQ